MVSPLPSLFVRSHADHPHFSPGLRVMSWFTSYILLCKLLLRLPGHCPSVHLIHLKTRVAG